ncbi:MAG: Flp pilus assembly protein CpaB [Pseudomonadota bacterium]
MRLVAVFVLIAGLSLAAGASWYVYAQVQAAEARLNGAQEPQAPIRLIELAVVQENVRFGQQLLPEHVKMVPWPREAAPLNGFARMEDLFGDGSEPRTVLRRMEPNEPVLSSKVTGFGVKATVAALLDPGMLAFTIPVNVQNSVGGFLLPGSRIDVFLTVNDRETGPITRLVMQNLEVIAIDQDTDIDRVEARLARTVTVQGDADAVARLTLASTTGSMSIALRGHGSDTITELAPLDRNELLGIEEQAVVAEAEPTVSTVRVRRAGAVEERIFQQ